MSHTLMPSEVDSAVSIYELRAIVAAHRTIGSDGNGQSATLPDSVRTLLATVLDALAEGRAVTLSPRRTTITTQEVPKSWM